MKAIAVIPARLASTRLPRKMLREIAGIPLIGHVYKAVRSSPLLEDVIVATDSDEIFQVCRKNDWNARMTSPDHRSGTERVQEISNSVRAEVYINVQGDEPMTRPEHIASYSGSWRILLCKWERWRHQHLPRMSSMCMPIKLSWTWRGARCIFRTQPSLLIVMAKSLAISSTLEFTLTASLRWTVLSHCRNLHLSVLNAWSSCVF